MLENLICPTHPSVSGAPYTIGFDGKWLRQKLPTWEVSHLRSRAAHFCTLSLRLLITFAHFVESAEIRAASASGVLPTGVRPVAMKCLRKSGSATARAVFCCSCSMTFLSVAAG